MYYTDHVVLGECTEGKALDIRKSVLRINDTEYSAEVMDGDLYSEFEATLGKGPDRLCPVLPNFDRTQGFAGDPR